MENFEVLPANETAMFILLLGLVLGYVLFLARAVQKEGGLGNLTWRLGLPASEDRHKNSNA